MSEIEQIPVTMTINGKKVRAHSSSRARLLIHFLREQLEPHRRRISVVTPAIAAPARSKWTTCRSRACMTFAVQANGANITTIEGMANRRRDAESALQEGFRHDARSAVRLLHARA
jgi:carbon-monoxide dehydrogenase small subunit